MRNRRLPKKSPRFRRQPFPVFFSSRVNNPLSEAQIKVIVFSCEHLRPVFVLNEAVFVVENAEKPITSTSMNTIPMPSRVTRD